MERFNVVIDCDVTHLNAPTRPFFAAKGFAHAACLRRIPADVSAVSMRIGEHAYAAKSRPDGTWVCEIPATALAESGESIYKVTGKTDGDLDVFIGSGRLSIEDK